VWCWIGSAEQAMFYLQEKTLCHIGKTAHLANAGSPSDGCEPSQICWYLCHLCRQLKRSCTRGRCSGDTQWTCRMVSVIDAQSGMQDGEAAEPAEVAEEAWPAVAPLRGGGPGRRQRRGGR